MDSPTHRYLARVPTETGSPLPSTCPAGPMRRLPTMRGTCAIAHIIASPPSITPLGWMSRYRERIQDCLGSGAQFAGSTVKSRASSLGCGAHDGRNVRNFTALLGDRFDGGLSRCALSWLGIMSHVLTHSTLAGPCTQAPARTGSQDSATCLKRVQVDSVRVAPVDCIADLPAHTLGVATALNAPTTLCRPV